MPNYARFAGLKIGVSQDGHLAFPWVISMPHIGQGLPRGCDDGFIWTEDFGMEGIASLFDFVARLSACHIRYPA